MNQCNIVKIENGFIVSLPPKAQTVEGVRGQIGQLGQQPQGRAIFCADVDAVVECLRENL